MLNIGTSTADIRWDTVEQEYPRMASACEKFGKLCPYHPLCTSGHGMFESIAEAQFDVEPYEPGRQETEEDEHGTD